jgi:uncharacterized membrane-anchored protein
MAWIIFSSDRNWILSRQLFTPKEAQITRIKITNMKTGFVTAFLILAIIQWVIPGNLIWSKNNVLKKGVSYKFKMEPVDPYYPFKGKYITLNFAETSFTDTVTRQLRGNEPVFVILSTDHRGFAKVKALSREEPESQHPYVRAIFYYSSQENDNITVQFGYPFDKFYMNEYHAPQAETIFRESMPDSLNTAYALVKIHKGEAVIENVFINEKPIRSLIQ